MNVVRKNMEDSEVPTQEEMLSMSEEEYMNEAQKRYFRKVLKDLEQSLMANASGTSESLRENDNSVIADPADRASLEEEHELELRTRERELRLLKKVQRAITLLDTGEYGWCEESGEPIGVARLMARPTATLSIESQERRELKQRLFGD